MGTPGDILKDGWKREGKLSRPPRIDPGGLDLSPLECLCNLYADFISAVMTYGMKLLALWPVKSNNIISVA
jgi:hypothetical protein